MIRRQILKRERESESERERERGEREREREREGERERERERKREKGKRGSLGSNNRSSDPTTHPYFLIQQQIMESNNKSLGLKF